MKITEEELIVRKKKQQKITMLTSYDFPTAKILDSCGIDVQLIGDSVGTNMLGYNDVSEVTVSDMLHHLKAVVRGTQKSFVLCDMPYASFDSLESAYKNASLFYQAGADGVKIESEMNALDKIAYVVKKGIPVCAHIGYTPQTPGLTAAVQGKDITRALELITLAKKCEETGVFMIVLELIPEKLAQVITQILSIPTIGIGAGRYCDGQVQVIYDLIGISEKIYKHAKKYTDISTSFTDAISSYIEEVQNGNFPTEKNSAKVPNETMQEVYAKLGWMNDLGGQRSE